MGFAKEAMKIERRKSPRFRVMEDDMVVMGSNLFATVRDIGAGGMQLQYFPETCEAGRWSPLDVVAGDRSSILMADVCCSRAYDIANLNERGTFSGMNVRLCGLVFGELSPAQKTILRQLLERCGSCETSMR